MHCHSRHHLSSKARTWWQITRIRLVVRLTSWWGWFFDKLGGSHLQSLPETVFVSRLCYKSDPLKLIGQLSLDVIGCRIRQCKFRQQSLVAGSGKFWSVLVVIQIKSFRSNKWPESMEKVYMVLTHGLHSTSWGFHEGQLIVFHCLLQK